MLSGTAPIPASGQITRHRLNGGGDRQLNRALHTIVLSRMRFHRETRAYVARRTAQGSNPPEQALLEALRRPPTLYLNNNGVFVARYVRTRLLIATR
jgi:hypothetical protein